MKRRENVPYSKMKAKSMLFALILTFTFSLSTVMAQNDTMYVMKNGKVVGKYNVNTEVDSIRFYQLQTQPGNTYTDSRDGNIYQTVIIGTQVWMAENLKYLPSVVGPGTGTQTTPYYYVNGYDGTNVTEAKATSNYNTYGVLYNWSAAMNGATSSTSHPSGVQGVCPNGWHLPSDAEWTLLTDNLGGESVAGGKLKEIGWGFNNEATNETGFTARGGGYRRSDGRFDYIGNFGCWWSASEYLSSSAWGRFMTYSDVSIVRWYDNSKELGFSIRCVGD